MNLADKAILNVLARSSEAFFLLASSVVLVRYLTKADYGTFLQLMLIANTAVMIALFGLPQSIYYFYHRVIAPGVMLLKTFMIAFGLGLSASVIVYFMRRPIAHWINNETLVEYGWVTAALIVLRIACTLREPALISHGSLILNSIVTLVCNGIIFMSLILAARYTSSLTVVLHVMVVTYAIHFFVSLVAMLWVSHNILENSGGAHSLEGKAHAFKIWDQMKYAFPLGISSHIGIIGRQIDQYIVSSFFNPREFAVYSRGAMRIPVIFDLPFIINDIMMSKYVINYTSNNIHEFLKLFHTCIEKVVKVNFPVFAFLMAVAPSVIVLLYTEEYADATFVFRIYLCMLLICVTTFGVVPRASGQTAAILYASVFALLANILASVLLVHVLGPPGAALGTVITTLIPAVYLLMVSGKQLKVTLQALLPWRLLTDLIVVALVASIPVYVIEGLVKARGLMMLLALVGEGITYLYCFLFLMVRRNLIYPDDYEILKKWSRFDFEAFFHKVLFIREVSQRPE